MIPLDARAIDELMVETERQRAQVSHLFSEAAPSTLLWRPDDGRWSITGHLAHLGLVNEAYLGAITEVIGKARSRGGPMSDGPYRHPRLSRMLVRTMEPPPKRRVKTFRSMVPDPGIDAATALADFVRLQDRLAGQLSAARGLDLGRIRLASPFFRLLRLSLGGAFETLLAHNRRHIWLIDELVRVWGASNSSAG